VRATFGGPAWRAPDARRQRADRDAGLVGVAGERAAELGELVVEPVAGAASASLAPLVDGASCDTNTGAHHQQEITMFIRHSLGRVVAAGIALAACAVGLPATSHAAPALATACFLPTSSLGPGPKTASLTLNGSDVTFGSSGLDSTTHNPVCPGTVAWDLSANSVSAHVTGVLTQRNNAGITARLNVRSYDVFGTQLHTKYGSFTATKNLDTHPIDITTTADPATYRVRLTTQKLNGTSWVDVDDASAYLGSKSHPDVDATIYGSLEKFGGDGGLDSSFRPIKPGQLYWDFDGGYVRAGVKGDIYFHNQAGAHARMRLVSYDVHGNQVDDWPMPTKSATVDGVDTEPVWYETAGKNSIYHSVLTLEVDIGGTWKTKGSPVDIYL
jgi:hypothetical protein